MCEVLMEIMKDDIDKRNAENMAKAEEKGNALGQQKLGLLIVKLKELGRFDDAFKAAEDSAYREKLYKELQIA